MMNIFKNKPAENPLSDDLDNPTSGLMIKDVLKNNKPKKLM